jgi:hypothetical protein
MHPGWVNFIPANYAGASGTFSGSMAGKVIDGSMRALLYLPKTVNVVIANVEFCLMGVPYCRADVIQAQYRWALLGLLMAVAYRVYWR